MNENSDTKLKQFFDVAVLETVLQRASSIIAQARKERAQKSAATRKRNKIIRRRDK